MRQLPRAPLQEDPIVTPQPAGSKGLAADEVGRAHIASKEGRWTIEFVSIDNDIANTSAHTGGSGTLSIPGLRAGDYAFLMGKTDSATVERAFIVTVNPRCATDGQVNYSYFNSDSAAVNPGSQTYYFMVIHRSIVS